MTNRDDSPPTEGTAPTGETPTILWVMALVAVLAALASRAVGPALPGIWVGIDPVITGFKLGAALVSQLFAVASTAVVIGLVLATVQAPLPSYLRAFAVGTGVLAILAVMIAAAIRLPHASRLVLAVATAVLALMGGVATARYLTSRAPALVLGSVAVSGLMRVVTILIAGAAKSEVLATIATVMATLAWALEAVAVVVALVWLVTQPRVVGGALRRPKRPRFIALALLLAGVGGLSVAVRLGHAPDAVGATVLLARAVDQLLSNPAPFTPAPVREGLELLRWLVALAVLFLAPRGRMMAATVALGLVASGTLEVPLCAVSLVIAVLALALHPGPDLSVDLPELSARSTGRATG